MLKNWEQLIYTEAVMVNPRVHLEKGKPYPFLDMASVDPSARCAWTAEWRPFTGGGARFAVGDTLLARITPCLENGKIARYCGQLAHEAHGSTEFIVIRGRGNITDSAYAYYLTKWEGVSGYAISQMTGTSGRQRVPTESLSNLIVPVPPLPEQRRIAHILGTLDDKIENNRKTAKSLEAMAQAIFKSWFVDFDPVRAKMAGESRESICKRLKLTPEILDLFPDRLVDSELGEIPEGWGNVPFSECVTIIGGGTPKTSVLEYWDGNIPWFSIVDAPIGDGIWVVDTEKKISESGLNNSSTRILPIGTTIITARGTVGRVAIVGVPMAMNQSCYGLRGKYDELGLFTHFSTRLIIKELLQRAHGSVFDTITRDTLESIEVTLPPTGIIDWFERMISLPMERLKQYSEETHIVTMLRDTLLPKLISGEIRVPDVDSIVGDSIRELHRDDLSKGTA